MAAQRGQREGAVLTAASCSISVTATSSHHRRFWQRAACMDEYVRLSRRNGDRFSPPFSGLFFVKGWNGNESEVEMAFLLRPLYTSRLP